MNDFNNIYANVVVTGDVTNTKINYNNIGSNNFGVMVHPDLGITNGPVDATNNWWGSEDPNFDNIVSGNVAYSPWLENQVGTEPMTFAVDNVGPEPAAGYIQTAVNGASSGDTVSMREGTYEENLTVDVENLTLRSLGSIQDTILDVSEKSAPGIKVTMPNVTIEGFTIIGIPNDGSTGSGVLYTMQGTSGADDFTIKNNIFDAPSGTIAHEALYLPNDADGVTFANNEVNDYIQGVGARENIDNLLVKDSTFNMENLTVAEDKDPDAELENVVVGRAIQLWWGTGIEVIRNDFNGPGKFSEMAKNENDLINAYAYSDFITYFEKQGTDVGEGIVTVKNNVIDNFYLGFGFFAKGGEVTNNTIENNLWGLQLGQESEIYANTGTTGLNISKNEIRNNKIGIFAQNIAADGLSVQYNNIVNNSEYGIKNIDSVTLDATYNWWGDSSGPSGEGSGEGDAVSENVVYNPWLLEPKDVTQTYYDHCQALESGWNLISTPKILETENLSEIIVENAIEFYTYDESQWNPTTSMEPLDSVFVKMADPGGIGFEWTTSVQVAPPTKQLEESWNLIGSSVNLPSETSVSVDEALNSIADSWSTVYSPALNQETWTVTTGTAGTENMLSWEGYWLYMTAPDELAGRTV